MWTLLKAFSVSIDVLICLFTFVLLIWWITFVYFFFLMLNSPCISWTNPTWSLCNILLIHCWIYLIWSYFVEDFWINIHIHEKYYNFFSYNCVVSVLGLVALIEWIQKYFLCFLPYKDVKYFLLPLQEIVENLYNFFKCFVEFTSEHIWA